MKRTLVFCVALFTLSSSYPMEEEVELESHPLEEVKLEGHESETALLIGEKISKYEVLKRWGTWTGKRVIDGLPYYLIGQGLWIAGSYFFDSPDFPDLPPECRSIYTETNVKVIWLMLSGFAAIVVRVPYDFNRYESHVKSQLKD